MDTAIIIGYFTITELISSNGGVELF